MKKTNIIRLGLVNENFGGWKENLVKSECACLINQWKMKGNNNIDLFWIKMDDIRIWTSRNITTSML